VASVGQTSGATGIVLAGGGSVRFGRDKLAEPYRGMPLLHHAVLRLVEVCGDVVLVLAPEAPEPELPIGAPVRIARDATAGKGPLAGLLAGLGVTQTNLALVSGGDMPELATAVLIEMLKVAAEAPVQAVVLADGDRWRPLPMVVLAEAGRGIAPVLLAEDRRSLRGLLEGLRIAVIDEPTWLALDPERRTLLDVDEPADLDG
jgi:molybdenum cofactor guanylyltransferase